MPAKYGVFLNNIGTPTDPSPKAVGKYLTEFLMDKEILTIPFLIRWLLVHFIIVPRRKYQSSERYKKIWQQDGSPLLKLTEKFAHRLQVLLGEEYLVKIGMRYGNPSIREALEEFKKQEVNEILFCPLYPQYARATSESSLEKLKTELTEMGWQPKVHLCPPFYSWQEYTESLASQLRGELSKGKFHHVLFSFHGLPESQIKKVENCLINANCCDEKGACDKNCYRAQCFQTARSIAAVAKLPEQHFEVGFQSRVGPAKWIGPDSLKCAEDIAVRGLGNLLVVSPAFVVDGLETLEEIAIEMKGYFLEAGGQDLKLLPCLNDDESWTAGFAKRIKLESHYPKWPVI